MFKFAQILGGRALRAWDTPRQSQYPRILVPCPSADCGGVARAPDDYSLFDMRMHSESVLIMALKGTRVLTPRAGIAPRGRGPALGVLVNSCDVR